MSSLRKHLDLVNAEETVRRSTPTTSSSSGSDSDSDSSLDASEDDDEITHEYLDSLLEKARKTAEKTEKLVQSPGEEGEDVLVLPDESQPYAAVSSIRNDYLYLSCTIDPFPL